MPSERVESDEETITRKPEEELEQEEGAATGADQVAQRIEMHLKREAQQQTEESLKTSTMNGLGLVLRAAPYLVLFLPSMWFFLIMSASGSSRQQPETRHREKAHAQCIKIAGDDLDKYEKCMEEE